jgi:hypothetical protein
MQISCLTQDKNDDWDTSFGLCRFEEVVGDLPSDEPDSQLKVTWFDARSDHGSFKLQCVHNRKVHKRTRRCETLQHALWTDVITRSAVLVVDVNLDKHGKVTPICLRLISDSQERVSSKRLRVKK